MSSVSSPPSTTPTVRRRLDLSIIPTSSAVGLLPREDYFKVSVGVLFCLSSRKKNKIDIDSLDVYYRDLSDLTPPTLQNLFISVYNSFVQQQQLMAHPEAEPKFMFEYGRTYEFAKVTADTISGWVLSWSTTANEKKKLHAFSIRVSPENVSPADYTAFKKASVKEECRRISVEQLKELNDTLNAPLSAWNSWAELFLKDATVQANTVPNQLAHLFRRVDLPLDDETDGFEMGFMVEELARRLETVERKRRKGVEDLIEDLPDIMRTARKRSVKKAAMCHALVTQFNGALNVENSHPLQ
ncbi:hypothetical protein GEMRC1_008576 [Eukaryota sp. GEM-RC1]